MKVDFARRALREIERPARWWREHLPAAPDLFEQELRRAVEDARVAPDLHSRYCVRRERVIRRVLMPKTGYHLYFFRVAPDALRVLSVWGGRRERGPRL